MSKRASKVKLPPGRWTPAAVKAFNEAPGDMLRVKPTPLELKCNEQQSRLDAIAAISHSGVDLNSNAHALFVLATGKPKRELGAALKRWSKPKPDHETERIKLEMHKSAKGSAELGQALKRTGRRL